MRIQAKVAVAPPVDRHVAQRPERGQRCPLLIVAAAVDRRAGALGKLPQDLRQRVYIKLVAVAPGRQRLVRALEAARDALRVHKRTFALR